MMLVTADWLVTHTHSSELHLRELLPVNFNKTPIWLTGIYRNYEQSATDAVKHRLTYCLGADTLIKSIGLRGDFVHRRRQLQTFRVGCEGVRVYVNERWSGRYVQYVLHVPATAVTFATATPGVGTEQWKEINLRKSLKCTRK